MFNDRENLLITTVGWTKTNDLKWGQWLYYVRPKNIRNAEDVGKIDPDQVLEFEFEIKGNVQMII